MMLPANLPDIASANAADVYLQHSQEGPWPDAPGVYGFWEGETCRYIGESRNLRNRLATHDRKATLRACRVRWLVCGNHKTIELRLIAALKPTDNRKVENWRAIEAERDKNKYEHLQVAYLIPRDGQRRLVEVAEMTDEEIDATLNEHERLVMEHVRRSTALRRYKIERKRPMSAA